MADHTTDGFEAEPTDVAGLLEHLCGDLLDEPDPLIRYTRLTAEQALYDGLVSAIKVERGKALRAMSDSGLTYEQIAASAGLGGKQRVSQLIAAATG